MTKDFCIGKAERICSVLGLKVGTEEYKKKYTETMEYYLSINRLKFFPVFLSDPSIKFEGSLENRDGCPRSRESLQFFPVEKLEELWNDFSFTFPGTNPVIIVSFETKSPISEIEVNGEKVNLYHLYPDGTEVYGAEISRAMAESLKISSQLTGNSPGYWDKNI